MTRDLWREETIESRWEATAAVVLVIAVQLGAAFVSLRQDWALPWWVWLIPVPRVRSTSSSSA
ncbi:MAG: hypothetical protein ACRDNH_02360 [Gaiellaceae bacterium]